MDGPDVDLRRLKEAARRLYPPAHPIRQAIEREPDALPRSQALGLLESYVRMAWALPWPP